MYTLSSEISDFFRLEKYTRLINITTQFGKDIPISFGMPFSTHIISLNAEGLELHPIAATS